MVRYKRMTGDSNGFQGAKKEGVSARSGDSSQCRRLVEDQISYAHALIFHIFLQKLSLKVTWYSKMLLYDVCFLSFFLLT